MTRKHSVNGVKMSIGIQRLRKYENSKKKKGIDDKGSSKMRLLGLEFRRGVLSKFMSVGL